MSATARGGGRVLRSSAGQRGGRPRGPGRATTAARCTGGWLASYVEKAGSFGHFLSPRDHYLSRWSGRRRRLQIQIYLTHVVTHTNTHTDFLFCCYTIRTELSNNLARVICKRLSRIAICRQILHPLLQFPLHSASNASKQRKNIQFNYANTSNGERYKRVYNS